MLTTRMSCRLNCLICHLSGLHVLVIKLVQVSGASCSLPRRGAFGTKSQKYSLYLEQQ